MEIQAPFGIVTACYSGCIDIVGATLASIRHYHPDVPICLTVDGDFEVKDLEDEYDLVVLRIDDMQDQEMAGFIRRSFHAKHAAMWEGPFESYLYLDADAIIWGELIPQIQSELDFQIFWDGVSLPQDAEEVPDWMPHYYLNPEKLKGFDANFDWRGLPYFCAGAFACRRNVIPFEKYREVESWGQNNPGTFAWGDMGILNYLVHSQAQRGNIRVGMTDLQNIPEYNGKEEFELDCEGSRWRFPENISRPRVGHFCGRKPNIFDTKAYSKPFTIARLEHHRRRHSRLGAWGVILWEDGLISVKKILGRLRRKLRLG